MYAWVFYKFNNNNLCNFNYSNKTYQNDSYDENILITNASTMNMVQILH